MSETSFVQKEYTRLLRSPRSKHSSTYDSTTSNRRKRLESSTALTWKDKTKRNFKKRLISSKAVFFILAVNALQSFCSNAVVQSSVQYILQALERVNSNNPYSPPADSVYDKNFELAAGLVFGIQTGLPALFYPVGGILGDVYVGRHKMSLVCLFISFFSYVFLSFTLSVSYNVPGTESTIAFGIVLPLIALLLISMSNGIFNINWLTFGADQLINSPSEEISSYIYYWYWTKNLGLALAIVMGILLEQLSNLEGMRFIFPSIAPFVSAVCISIAIFINNRARSLYDHERINTNPLKQVFGVIGNALTSRPKKAQFTSAFRYGDDPPSGLEYARQYYDGKYTDEQVGDVRSCARIFIIVAMISGYTAVYFGFHNKAASAFELTSSVNSALASTLPSLMNSSIILVLVPVWNNLIFPLMGHYLPNTRKRLGFGILVGAMGMLLAGMLYTYMEENKTLFGLFFIPLVVIVAAESLVFVPVLEFIYAQSPDNMKGLLIGLHYFLIGVWATICFVSLKVIDNGIHNLEQVYYLTYFGIGFVGFILFVFVNCFYSNRRRNNPITDIMRISKYY